MPSKRSIGRPTLASCTACIAMVPWRLSAHPARAYRSITTSAHKRARLGAPMRKATSICGISGVVQVNGRSVADLERRVQLQSTLLSHRGPDGAGIWLSPGGDVGFCHRRLAIIALTEQASQPMIAPNETV